MPKKGTRRPKPIVGDPNDPEGLFVWMKRFLEALRVKNCSERTVENRESYLSFFIAWCEARSISRPQEVTKPILERYQRHLFHLRKPDGKPLAFSGRGRRGNLCEHSRGVPCAGLRARQGGVDELVVTRHAIRVCENSESRAFSVVSETCSRARAECRAALVHAQPQRGSALTMGGAERRDERRELTRSRGSV